MPLYRHWKEGDAEWGIWKVSESAEELRAMLTGRLPYDVELDSLKAQGRKMEYLAVRVLLKTLTGKEYHILHESSGKPYVEGHLFQLTISHTKGYVAVGLHPSAEVGMDIEQCTERVRKVMSRFIHLEEIPHRDSLSPEEMLSQQLIHWSAKETLYKVLGCQEVDFVEHLRVMPFEVGETGTLSGAEHRTGHHRLFQIRYLLHPDFVCTWCVCLGL